MPSGQPREQKYTWSGEHPLHRRGHLRSPNLNDGISASYATKAQDCTRFQLWDFGRDGSKRLSRTPWRERKENCDRVHHFIRVDLIGVRILPLGSTVSVSVVCRSLWLIVIRSSSRPITCCTRVCLCGLRVSASRTSQPSLNTHPNSTMTNRAILRTCAIALWR